MVAAIYKRRAKGRYALNRSVTRRGQRKKFKRAGTAGNFYSKLMPCTAKYAASLIDPTSEKTRGACIPQGFPIPSQKVRCFMRGICGPGTGGSKLGYLMFTPAIANDATMIRYTASGSAGNAVSASTFNDVAAYIGTNVAMSKLPYSGAELAAGDVEGRFVSGCIRIRPSGTELARGGILTLIETPDHEDLNIQSYNTINQYECSSTDRPSGDGEWTQINWSGPARTGETTYVNTTSVTAGRSCMMIVIQQPGGTGATDPSATYEYECWVNVEYIGRVAVGKTNVEIDAQGFGQVQQVMKSVTGTQPLNPTVAQQTGLMSKISSLAARAASWATSSSGKATILKTARAVASVLGRRGGKSTHQSYYKDSYLAPKIFGNNPYNL